MVFIPIWALERVAYWIMFALMVLSIEKLGRKMKWYIFRVGSRTEKVIIIMTILGIIFLFSWAIFH